MISAMALVLFVRERYTIRIFFSVGRASAFVDDCFAVERPDRRQRVAKTISDEIVCFIVTETSACGYFGICSPSIVFL
jgi:hypothetical protein